ncbi:unnamed protein product [Lepeophtheirus salmonis]|uniref:(salmon louse) hypothetical protein n=1 Tax=Lepeophtheirus salmonis TaxID=72036 RepID=A0A7R8CU42_LEPSM|nr:unnamed protein product [Lepeophtheirus salmonis]CAF2931876.1 unnamed protein product [Lepeophtheirus salmonis]
MSTIITEEIVKDIGEAWYTLNIYGTKYPISCDDISIVLCNVDTTNTLRDIGLNTAKVLNQCYDGASVMSEVHGVMQKIVQEELLRKRCHTYTALTIMKVILKSIDNIVHLLCGIESTQTSANEVRMEATGIFNAITQPNFMFISCMTHLIMTLLDLPNSALQAKSTDLYMGSDVSKVP